MISEKGQTQTVTWRSIGNPELPEPDKPWNPGSPTVSVDHPVDIAFLPNERYGRETFRYFSGTDIPVGNLLGFMAQVDFKPSLKDVVIRDGVEIPILSFNPYDPNGEGVILYAIEFDGIKSV